MDVVDATGDAVVDGMALRVSSIASQSVGLAHTLLHLPRSSRPRRPAYQAGRQVALASALTSVPPLSPSLRLSHPQPC